jgi:hypothetical protein
MKCYVSNADYRIFQVFVPSVGLFGNVNVLLTARCPILFHKRDCNMNKDRAGLITC